MNKKFCISMLLLTATVGASAQVAVDSIGRMSVGSSSVAFINPPVSQLSVTPATGTEYAGYFNGSVFVTGKLKASLYHYADEDNSQIPIGNVSEQTSRNILQSIQRLQVYAPSDSEGADIGVQVWGPVPDDGDDTTYEESDFPGNSTFFITASSLKQTYPSLVASDSKGYKMVNYAELVPILVQAIKELTDKVEALEVTAAVASQQPMSSPSVSRIASADASVTGNVLYQNTPNPFKEQTVIRFRLADDAQTAAICIFDMQGKLLKKQPVSQGMESITVNGYELGEGLFLYSLVVNGQEIATKRMILTK